MNRIKHASCFGIDFSNGMFKSNLLFIRQSDPGQIRLLREIAICS